MTAPLTVTHDAAAGRFEAQLPQGVAFASYRREGDVLAVFHTEVPPALQGRGIAAELVAGMLEQVRAQGLKVRPLCSYVAAHMRRHPQTQDLLAP